MKLTTIGYWGAYPQANEATSCYLIEDEGVNILLDCGSGALAKLQNYINLVDLDAVFISHVHADHIIDLYSLEYAMLILQQLGIRKKALDVYIYSDKLDGLPFEFPKVMHIHQIHLTDSIQVGKMKFTFSENLHEVPCCSIKITNEHGKTIVYSADTGYTESLIDFSRNADVLLIECSLYMKQKGLVKGHLASCEVGIIANEANVKEVILTHFPHYGEKEKLISEVSLFYSKKISNAHEGFSITL